MATDLVEFRADGRLRLHLHPGQWKAWSSTARFVVVLAGTQGGKTSFGPHWLYREIQRGGPGDYLVITPTFPLLEMKALPEFLRLFEQILGVGRYVSSPTRKFVFSDDGARRTFGNRADPLTPTNVFFGYAADPESLESATAKAAWLDEAGQKRFKLGSWEAILRRLSLAMGRALITTTPYDLGWIKRKLWDAWQAGDTDIEVIRFDSTENPRFPQAEFERARRSMQAWKFDLFYRAIFTRPAGLIYTSFDERLHTCPRFAVPSSWQRYLGLDFGGVNTAGLFYAEEPSTNRLFLYREYKAGERTAKQHVDELLRGEPMLPTTVGGSKSEGQWRSEFRAAGLPVQAPTFSDVEVGIDRVFAAHAAGQIVAFSDLAGYLEEKTTYSREVNEVGDPTEEIEDKHAFHFMDAERYIVGWLRDPIAVAPLDAEVVSVLSGFRG